MTLSPELRAWLVPGRPGTIAAVDSSGQPQIARVWAARAREGLDVIEVHVQRSAAAGLLEAVARGGRAALVLSEVLSYRSLMFRGRCQPSESEVPADFVDRSIVALEAAFLTVGMAPETPQRILAHGDEPRVMVVLSLEVEAVFDKSPKPGAGARL